MNGSLSNFGSFEYITLGTAKSRPPSLAVDRDNYPGTFGCDLSIQKGSEGILFQKFYVQFAPDLELFPPHCKLPLAWEEEENEKSKTKKFKLYIFIIFD